MKDKLSNIFSKKNIHYIESITYVLSVIVVVIANVFGPIWIRMLPLLFILGIIGKIVFDRPVVTTIFGAIISVCTVYLSGVTDILENIIASGIFTLYIALGEFCGSKIENIYKYLICGKKISKKEFYINISYVISIVIICTVFHNYTDSNIFIYNSCKNRLENYLSDMYPNNKFNIVCAKYNFKNENNFNFNVQDEITNDSYKFVVYVDKKLDIYDGIKESQISKIESKVEERINKILDVKYENINKKVVKINEGYELNLIKEVEEINDIEVLDFSNEVSQIIDSIIEIKELENILHVNISLIDKKDKTKSKISTIYLSGYMKNKEEGIQKSYTYIMKSLDIEYID